MLETFFTAMLALSFLLLAWFGGYVVYTLFKGQS